MKTRKLLESLASLRLTVALLAMAMMLIFAGTLAQANMGVWQAVDTYFRSLIAWIDLQLFVPRQVARVPFSLPFPGGLLIGAAMVVNLLAAHGLRFRLAGKRIGIVVLHAGLILLLTGEFVTAMLAEEGLMSIDEGSSSDYVEDVREVELAVIDASNPEKHRVAAIPESLLLEAVRSGEPIEPKSMPFSVEIDQWMPNARLLKAQGETRAKRGIGQEAVADELAEAAKRSRRRRGA